MQSEWEDAGIVWEIEEADEGIRIDKYLTEMLEGSVSRSLLQRWIKEGHARIDGRMVKPNYKLAAGDVLELVPPEEDSSEWLPEPIPLNIVYEDDDVIVVNKPRGMVVHPAPGHASGTLVNALLHHSPEIAGLDKQLRAGLVHRIDKDTSGLLMAAKNERAHQYLSEQLKLYQVERKYFALVHGEMQHNEGTVDAPIGRDPHDRKKFAVTDQNSKRSVTHFKVAERFKDFTLLELQLETGRTHQIRVHMKFIGFPVVGDPLYGRASDRKLQMKGQALHAASLGFKHPTTQEYCVFQAPLPEDMEKLLEWVRQRSGT